MLKRSTQKSSKKLIFLLSICMGMAHIVNSQIIVQGVNHSSGTHRYCSNGYLVSPNSATYPVNISGTADVKYTASTYILLKPGFRVSGLSATGKFATEFGACPVTVSNTSSSFACTYSVKVTVNDNLGNPLPAQTYSIAPGQTQVYVFTPLPGNSLNLSSLNFETKTSTCSINNFQLASNVAGGNCMNCSGSSGSVTVWTNNDVNNNNNFQIRADLIVGTLSKNAAISEQEGEKLTIITENHPSVNITSGALSISDNKEISKNNANDHANTFKISPNPSAGVFIFTAKNENVKDVFVYDITGRIVFEKTNTTLQTLNIDITHCPQGIYILKAVGDNQTSTEKIIKAPGL